MNDTPTHIQATGTANPRLRPGMIYLHLIACIAIAAILPALTGCRAGKSATGTTDAGTANASKEIASQSPLQRYDALCAGYSEWQDVNMPVKLSLTEPQNLGISARAMMKRNEWISLSVRMLGFELASVWIDNDSVHATDKYHKLYLSESIDKIFAGAGVTIAEIQDLLMGRGFLLGDGGGTFTLPIAPQLTFENTDAGLIILPASKLQGFDYGFILYPDANNILAATVSVGSKYNGVVTYTDFRDTGSTGTFARTVRISIDGLKKAEASIVWDLGSAKWDSGETRSWKRPKGYTRISADKLLKTLSLM